MISGSVETELGRLELRALDEPCAREIVPLALEAARACRQGSRVRRRVELGGRAAWLKASALRGAASARHTLRSRLLGIAAPRVREAANLAWLVEHGFRAPQPLAAGTLERGGLLRFQFLASAFVDGARPLPRAWAELDARARESAARELGGETGRLHALEFLHHDLLARNVLVAPDGGRERLVFIDAWRGGPGSRLRRPDYDLGCLMLAGAGVFSLAEQRVLFDAYFEARAGLDVRARARLLESSARVRDRLLRQLEREPGRWREAGPPRATWDWSALCGRA